MRSRVDFRDEPPDAESPLVELLRRPGCVQLLDAFLAHRGLWLTVDQLEGLAEVDQSTVSRNIDAFGEVDLVEMRGSHPTEYRLNEDHPATKPLADAYRELHAYLTELADEDGNSDVDSPFYVLLQSEGRVRLIDTLLNNRSLWVTAGQLSERADVSQSTVSRRIDDFVEINLVEDEGSHPTTYRLNEDHPVTEPLAATHRELHNYTTTLARYSWEIEIPTARETRSKIEEHIVADLEEPAESDDPEGIRTGEEASVIKELQERVGDLFASEAGQSEIDSEKESYPNVGTGREIEFQPTKTKKKVAYQVRRSTPATS